MKTHTFRGKRYRILTPHTKNWYGEEDAVSRTIKIARNQDEPRLLETQIHEGLHACLPDLDEAAVDATARDVARFLWRDGWRRTT